MLRRIALGLFALIALLAASAGALLAIAPRLDGPVAIVPGGPLRSGEWAAATADWSFAADVREVELQLESQARSRTTWILVENGRAYLPCSLGFPPGKTWHEEAVRDGRAILRVGGRRHRVTLTRVDDAALAERLDGIGKAKYGGGPPSDAGRWFFQVGARPDAGLVQTNE